MLQLLMNNIYVELGRHMFQKSIGIRIGTNCAPIIADPFLCLYEAEFIQILIKDKHTTEAKTFNLTFMYIDVCQLIIQTLLTKFH